MKTYHPDDLKEKIDDYHLARLQQCLINYEYFTEQLPKIIDNEQETMSYAYLNVLNYWKTELQIINDKIAQALKQA